jgi:hypothetical protein
MEYLYTPRYCYISPLCFTAQRRAQVHDQEGVKQVRMCPDCLSWSIYFLWLFVQSRAMTFTLPQALPLGFHAAMTPKPTVGARQ